MIKSVVLNIINRFIKNKLYLHEGFYSFIDKIDPEENNMEQIYNVSCVQLIEQALKEENYLKKDEKITRDIVYKLIVELENLSSESIILLMANIKNREQTGSDIDKFNSLLINKFYTNDIDFHLGLLLDLVKKKKMEITQIEYFLNNISNFNSMLCFLTDTPYNIETSVGIFNNILIDDNIDTMKVYKIKQKKNSLDLKVSKRPKCFDDFYREPLSNPISTTQSDVFLKEGWERIKLENKPVSGIALGLVNIFHVNLMRILKGKLSPKELDEVYFKNEGMCQRRWTNNAIHNIDEEDAYFDKEEYINTGEDVYNLYDPEVTIDTSKDSKIYENNQILKSIWFYKDDLFPVEPDKSSIYNILEQRAEYSFKTLRIENKDIFKQSPFKKEDLHLIIPILWLYKIYDEYKSIVSNEPNNNIDNNLETLFNYFNPKDLLIFVKRHILLEENSFDLETLSFFIILSSLSKVTSLLIDDRLHLRDLTNFMPKDFNLFGRLSIPDIKLLTKNYKLKPNSYLEYLKIIIPQTLVSDDLQEKLTYEYQNIEQEIRKYYIKNFLNIIQLIGSNQFKQIIMGMGYYSDFSLLKEYHYKNKMRQLKDIDKTIKDKIDPLLFEKSTKASNRDELYKFAPIVEESGEVLNTQLSSITNKIMPTSVDLSLTKMLIENISKDISTGSNLSTEQSVEALELLKLKSSIISNLENENEMVSLSTSLSPNISHSLSLPRLFFQRKQIQPLFSLVDKQKIVSSLLQNHNELMQTSKPSKLQLNNLQIVQNLDSVSEYYRLLFSLKNAHPESYDKKSIEQFKQNQTEMENQLAQLKTPIQELKGIASQVPKNKNIKSIKVIPHVHGLETDYDKRIIGDCGKFAYVGLLGEPGKYTAWKHGAKYDSQMFKGIPDASTLEAPTSRYCELPLTLLAFSNENNDNQFGGVKVQITYNDGIIENRNIASNQELIAIFEKNILSPKPNIQVTPGNIATFIPVLETLLELNGLDPTKASLSFPSCRNDNNSLEHVNQNSSYIYSKLSVNVDICQVQFNPILPHELIPTEVHRTTLDKDNFLGKIITIDKPMIFDPNNPRKNAGQLVVLHFKEKQFLDRKDDFICRPRTENQPSITIHYALLKAFNDYLVKNPQFLNLFNRLSDINRYKIFRDLVLNKDLLPIDMPFIKRKFQMEVPSTLDLLAKKYPDLDLDKKFTHIPSDHPFWKDYVIHLRDIYFHRHPLEIEEKFDVLFQQFFEPPENKDEALVVKYRDQLKPSFKEQADIREPVIRDIGLLLRQQIEKLHIDEESKFVKKGGTPDGKKKDDLIDKFSVEIFEEIKLFYNEFRNYGVHLIEIDPLIIDEINKLNITNTLKAMKIQIEKIKFQFLNKKKKKLTSDYLKFIYNYLYEVIYFELLNMVNNFKLEIENIKTKIEKAQNYFDDELLKCIKDTLYNDKLYKHMDHTLESKQKLLIKEYYELFNKLYSDKTVENIESTDIIIVLQQIYDTTLYDERFNYILEKYSNVIDLIIIERWAYYIMLYDIEKSCDIKFEIDKIEYELCKQKKISNNNILEPLTYFIPNYNELIIKNNYLDEALKLVRSKSYNCDFLYHYYQLIDNQINDIYTNIIYIRNINNDINHFFLSNRIEDIDNENGQKFLFNIYAYSHQLNYFLNFLRHYNDLDKFRNPLLIGNKLELWDPYRISDSNLLHENTKLENDKRQFPFQGIKDNMTVSTAISTPNTVEYELISLQKSYFIQYEKVKMDKFIYSLTK